MAWGSGIDTGVAAVLFQFVVPLEDGVVVVSMEGFEHGFQEVDEDLGVFGVEVVRDTYEEGVA
jgi:hypothetical protein